MLESTLSYQSHYILVYIITKNVFGIKKKPLNICNVLKSMALQIFVTDYYIYTAIKMLGLRYCGQRPWVSFALVILTGFDPFDKI